MQLDAARQLKDTLLQQVIAPLRTSPVARSSLGVPAGPLAIGGIPTLALGIAPRPGGNFALAVHIQQRALEQSPTLDLIRNQAHDEVDVRFVGLPTKRTPQPPAESAWHQKRQRPLLIGASVGHAMITAGTLGCFVRRLGVTASLVLSNNHVLANENRAAPGDAILQPGQFDGGVLPEDAIGVLHDFVKLESQNANLVDAAIAAVSDGLLVDPTSLYGLGQLKMGVDPSPAGRRVAKLGRTTGLTWGRVVAFDLDNLLIRFDTGILEFNGVITVEGEGQPFSQGGDSGSLLVDEEVQAVALLFAGTELGGSAGQGLTYASPLDAVLRTLNVELMLQ